MENIGQYTREEIFTQPGAWRAALGAVETYRCDLHGLLAPGRYAQTIFTGCGSTYYMALAAAALFQELTGRPARGLPASELWLSPQSSYPAEGRILLVAISRSGETTETLRACQAFLRQDRGDLLTLSCYADQPLSGLGTLNLVLPSGMERSVAQTRAFSVLYLATVALSALAANRTDLYEALALLPAAGERLLDTYTPLARQYGRDMSLDRFYILGSGPRYGLACELSLKMKEMTLSHSEPFHFMEFRHGPKSMVTASALVIGLVSEKNFQQEASVLEEIRTMGGQVLPISPLDAATSGSSDGPVMVPSNGAVHPAKGGVSIDIGLDEAIRNILYLPVGQILAFERSITKGLNPDRPHNLEAVVKLSY